MHHDLCENPIKGGKVPPKNMYFQEFKNHVFFNNNNYY